MSKQPITRETTVKSKIADLLSQGGFVATETRHNKGQLQLGICITSSKTHIFKIEFEKKQQFSVSAE